MGKVTNELQWFTDNLLPIKKGEKTTINALLHSDSRCAYFELLEDVIKDETVLIIKVNKLEPLTVKARRTKKKGEKALLFALVPYEDLWKELTATDDIEKYGKSQVTVTIESNN